MPSYVERIVREMSIKVYRCKVREKDGAAEKECESSVGV